ncbi:MULTISPECIES: ABC transporter substrate-binding protein [Anaerotruncus]|nr:ABC transporter substrate-binding protein [Anaerotruncus massiliensis (ex Togo et al. 2019)]
MKKLFAMLLTLALSLSLLAGCSSAPSESAAPSDNAAPSEAAPAGDAAPESGKKLQIGIVQVMEHPSLDQIRTSFLDEMARLGYGDDKVDYDYQNASGDTSNLNTICQKFAGDQKDLIVAIATPSAQAAASNAPEIPLVFSAVTDPVAAKLVADPDKPDGIITGTSDAIPVDQVFALMQQLTPGIETVGMLYNLGEVNSVSVIEEAKAYCDANNLKYVEANVTNSGEVQQAAQALAGKCQALYSPIDNTVATAMPALAEVAKAAKIPVYVGADSMVIDGGLATIGVNYVQLGNQTAAMAVKVLEGTPVSEIPVETLTNFATVVNTTTAEAIGVTIPDDLLATAQVVE